MMVKDIMRKEIKTVSPDISIKEAAKMMVEEGVGSLLVLENNKLKGIITERDMVEKVVAKSIDPKNIRVRDIMVKKLILATPDTEIEEAAKMMVKHHIKRLPVVFNNVLIGMITATEIIAAEPRILEEIEGFVLLTQTKKPVAG